MKRSLFMVVVPLFFLVLFLGVSNVICASPGQPEVEWSKTFGGSVDDVASSVIQTSDGGYALAGVTGSYGAGGFDLWLVKTDSSGNEEWSKTFGGSDDDSASSVIQTSDGGYALAGFTDSYGAGMWDLWLVKIAGKGEGLPWDWVGVGIAVVVIAVVALVLMRKGK